MIAALGLLVVALTVVLYSERDFWFPDTQATEEDLPATQPATSTPAAAAASPKPAVAAKNKSRSRAKVMETQHEPVAETAPGTTINRTVLPPLEVEVIASNSERKLRPGSNAVVVEMDRGSAPSHAATPAMSKADMPDTDQTDVDQTAASVTNNAAERVPADNVQVSAEAANVVTHSVTPGYPMLARQMKVQGSVILEALIGRDGLIQSLHVVSGPPILASAAQEAVKQWHFKPHYQGAEAVETAARITVNFTISTN